MERTSTMLLSQPAAFKPNVITDACCIKVRATISVDLTSLLRTNARCFPSLEKVG